MMVGADGRLRKCFRKARPRPEDVPVMKIVWVILYMPRYLRSLELI